MQMRGRGTQTRLLAGGGGEKMAAGPGASLRRVQLVLGHLAPSPPGPGTGLRAAPCGSRAGASPRAASPDDVVVVHGRRTAIGRAKRGAFKDTTPDELLSAVMTAVLRDVSLRPEALGDICVGNVLQPGAGALIARVAQFLSGIPETVPCSSVNRQCSSGLQAIINIAGGIRNGSYDIGLACGVETMSLRSANNPGDISSSMMENSKARDCLIPMGAAKAQQMGLFKTEIVPVKTTVLDNQGKQKTITVDQDEGIRPSTTLEGLAKLKPAFKEDGSTTAGNASQVSDGAAAVLLAKRSKAAQLGLPVLGVLRSFAVVGVPPDVMGIGPAYAIPVAVEKAGLTLNDIDIYEINEAFASQAVYCVEKLGIPMEKVNPLGGAIALGHPLGCTGARQVVTLLNELKRRGKRAYGVVSMCIGTGMGAAAVFEYPGN
uniref:Acetyl-CoA acyltransferase 1 n=1 Tax=Falco tinnunculus TaxID=100819 RepID=A0A8C4XMN6_FALTI